MDWEIIGHDWAIEQLQKAIIHGRIGHAYLLTGPSQVGRRTLAKALAAALNCSAEDPAARPCGGCRSCRLTAAGRHPDLREIEPEVTGRGNPIIRIDQIRELQRDLNLAAVEGRYKIAILRNFEATNLSAANAFLKTLEEPPSQVILILTATDADALLQTIRSRCRTLNLRPVNPATIELVLKKRFDLKDGEATRLAYLANGRIGWALQAAKDGTLVDTHTANLALLYEALSGARVGRFELADRLARKPDALSDLLMAWISWWRDSLWLALQHGEGGGVINRAEIDRLRVSASSIPVKKLLSGLRSTERALWQLERNANIRLVLENLLLRYPMIDFSRENEGV